MLPVTTYEHWHKSQINNKTRNLSSRPGRRAWWSAKLCSTMPLWKASPQSSTRHRFGRRGDSRTTEECCNRRGEFSRFLFRETLLGAYIGDELVGFIMLADAGRCATLTQIISLVRHRDKSPNNALIAKAVEVCAERQVKTGTRCGSRGPLREFKRQRLRARGAPAYYVPLTYKGRLAST